jgi:hypothetical protein
MARARATPAAAKRTARARSSPSLKTPAKNFLAYCTHTGNCQYGSVSVTVTQGSPYISHAVTHLNACLRELTLKSVDRRCCCAGRGRAQRGNLSAPPAPGDRPAATRAPRLRVRRTLSPLSFAPSFELDARSLPLLYLRHSRSSPENEVRSLPLV